MKSEDKILRKCLKKKRDEMHAKEPPWNGQKHIIFSSTGHRPASLCHGLLSVVHPSVLPCISQSTLPGDKASCIIAPIEGYSGYRHFQ